MRVLVIGGTGFIGYRLVRRLAARGATVTSMDIDPSAHSFADLGSQVASLRGDATQFDEVMFAMAEAKPDRVINLAYLIGEHDPHKALRLNVLGMDNCFEAARIFGVKHTVYAGSFAPNGKQSNYGEREVSEDDPVYGEYQYARHKIMNEWQALDYIEKHDMVITGIRCAYITGPDKFRGSACSVLPSPRVETRSPCHLRTGWSAHCTSMTWLRFLLAWWNPKNLLIGCTIPAAHL